MPADAKERCKAHQLRLQQVISLLRNNSTVSGTDCNLLENDINSLLAIIREARGWSTIELANICTLGVQRSGWRRSE